MRFSQFVKGVKKSCSGMDKLFVNPFNPSLSTCSWRKLPRFLGTNPVKELFVISKVVRCDRLEMVVGISPENIFIPRNKAWRFGSIVSMEDGMVPDSPFTVRESVCNLVRLKIDSGSSPFNLFSPRLRNVRLDRRPSSEGIIPSKLFRLNANVPKLDKLPTEGGIRPVYMHWKFGNIGKTPISLCSPVNRSEFVCSYCLGKACTHSSFYFFMFNIIRNLRVNSDHLSYLSTDFLTGK